MGCLPSRCRCEERILAPFIAHYNRCGDTTYEFKERLDVGSHTPQPEALYVDLHTGHRLVVERKNLIWPRDFAQIHDSLHHVADLAGSKAKPHLRADAPYELALPDRIRGKMHQLRLHGERMGDAIIRNIEAVHSGKTIRSRVPGREWSFRMEGLHERDWDEPRTGIRYTFTGEMTADLTGVEWGDIPDGLPQEFERLLTSASLKFANHGNAVRILVLDFMGDLRYPSLFVEKLFESVVVPKNVDEIWMSTHVLVTELHYGWIHQCLWPQLGLAESELCGETVVPLDT